MSINALNRSRVAGQVWHIVPRMIASQFYHPLHSSLHFPSRLG